MSNKFEIKKNKILKNNNFKFKNEKTKHKSEKKGNLINKKIIIAVISILLISISIYFIFFNKKEAKNLKIGNNSTSQEIVDYILNISSYQATIDIEIKSNKNTNKYKLSQKYISSDTSVQEVIEPKNIEGVKIVKNKNQVKVENTRLNLSKIYENYEYIAENCLDLNAFIEEYKTLENSCFEESNNQIIMKIENVRTNPNNRYKELYIDKKTGNPIKMEIKDDSKNTTIYILYNEIELNSIKENILAFNKLLTSKGV